MRQKLNVINEKYGKLTIKSEHSKTRNGHYRYVCQCECGNIANVLLTHLRQGNTTSCGCDRSIGPSHSQWTGIGEMSGDYWYNHIVRSANGDKGRRKPIELSISKEYAWDLFIKQNRKCALSGVELNFPKRNGDRGYNVSMDRIDSSLGYTQGNVQWVHKDINFIKRTYNQDHFIKMCKLVTENN